MAGFGLVSLSTTGILAARGVFAPAGLVLVALPLVMAGLIATRIAWMPALTGLLAATCFWFAWFPALIAVVANPPDAGYIGLSLAVVGQATGSALAAVAGFASTVQAYRHRGGPGAPPAGETANG
jgi:hypothetical protein